MSHTDPTILALRALGEQAGTPGDDHHLASCPDCQGELTRLAGLVEVARREGSVELLEPPPPHVWERIVAELGDGATQAPVPAMTFTRDRADDGQRPTPDSRRDAGHRPSQPKRRYVRSSRAGRRGRLATGLAGLAAGLVIGIAGAAGVAHLTRPSASHVIAQVELRPLPQFPQWHAASGTAVMRSGASQQVIAVTLSAPQRPGFYEVWLLARNGVSMISLGDLDASHTGSFTVPAGTDLGNYSRIDISLQAFDGSTQHSRISVVRGSLPPAATGGGRPGSGS